MITTVTLNPCVDLTVALPSFSPGKLNLVEKTRADISGKGINLAIVLAELNVPAVCAGINYTGNENGALLEEKLGGLGIPFEFVKAPGEMRTNIKIMDEAKNEMTELNGRGEPVSTEILDRVLEKLKALGEESEIIALGGRLPNGADEHYYRQCIEALSGYRAKIVVDADGGALKKAIEARPYLVKPNAYELGALFGCEVRTREDAVMLSREIIARGVEVVCCSMGEGGAVIVNEGGAYFSPALPIVPKGFQGAGDSMAAGICKAITEERPIQDMLRFGMAAAAASIIKEGTMLCERADYEGFLGRVEVMEVN